MQEAIVTLIIVAATMAVAWNHAVSKSAKRRLAGRLQAGALKRGRSPTARNALLKLADLLAPKCCRGVE